MSEASDRWLKEMTEAEAIRRGDPDLVLTDTEAAAVLAQGLMKGDPATFKQGYTRENALIAACDMFPMVEKAEVDTELKQLQAA